MSGPSTPAPTPYQPTNQAGADQGYQQGVNQLSGAATQLQNSTVPGYAAVTNNVTNNPYYDTTQQYAGLTSQIQGGYGTAHRNLSPN